MKTVLLFLLLPFIFFSAGAQSTIQYDETTLPDLLKRMDAGEKDILILDVRTRGEYHDTLSRNMHLNLGYIPGAVNIPMQDILKAGGLEQLNEFRNKKIHVICSHSYRSRVVTRLLLENEFPSVTNIRGGMSEWFRNAVELKNFMPSHYRTNARWRNISPSELVSLIDAKKKLLIMGFHNPPVTAFDTLMQEFATYQPILKNSQEYGTSDSAEVLKKARAHKGKAIIVYNIVGTAATEMAGWLASKGVENIHYLVGSMNWLYEHVSNEGMNAENYMKPGHGISFYSAPGLCRKLGKPESIILVDLRHDTLFSKITEGTRLRYRRIEGAVNFPYYLSADEFISRFPDREKEYVLIPHGNYTGTALAAELARRKYRIGWLMGGNERWEWFTNNTADFPCKNHFTLN